MTINKFRSVLYKTGKIAGDINAIKRGKIFQRIIRRLLGKFTGRLFSRLF